MKYNRGDKVRILPHAVIDAPELIGQVVTVRVESLGIISVTADSGRSAACTRDELELVEANPTPPRPIQQQFA